MKKENDGVQVRVKPEVNKEVKALGVKNSVTHKSWTFNEVIAWLLKRNKELQRLELKK